MKSLRVFGSLDLRGSDGEAIHAVLSQPKRSALLAYLAVARPRGFHRRDTLLGLFWPESDEEHARAALSTALSFLRRSLGEDVIVTRGTEEVALDPDAIHADVWVFEEALEADDTAGALEQYRGDLLEGFFLSGCPEFEQWLEVERQRLRRLASGAAWATAMQRIEEEELPAAELYGYRALALGGTDESAVRKFVQALSEAGDRAAAVRFYERFADALRKDLDVRPNAETRKLVEDIRASMEVPSTGAPSAAPRPQNTDGASALERLRTALAERYFVEREIGQGGMATVYLAHDVKHDRKVAVKVLHGELATRAGPKRFLKEIRITAKLQHPHILALHDSGEADDLIYYVMPYVQGESLRERLEHEHRLPVEEAVKIAESVATALDYAHRQGVIHRDVKPSNILLQDGQVVVADFGIALTFDALDSARPTGTGTSVGSPQYMSPEQASGDQEITARTDIYSLACVLYEMLAGEPPHGGADAAAVMAKKLVQPVPSIRVLRESVPQRVAAALKKALAKEPLDRYETAAEFRDTLSAGRADPPATGVPSVGWRRVAAVTIIILTMGLGGWWLSRGVRPALDPIEWIVVLPPENLLGDPGQDHLLAAMHVELISKLGQVPDLHVIQRQSSVAPQVVGMTIAEIAGTLGVDAVVTSQVMSEGDSVRMSVQLIGASPRERQVWEGTFTEPAAEQLALYGNVALGIAEEIQVRLTPQDRTRLASAPSVDPQAYEAYVRGNLRLLAFQAEAAVPLFQRAVELDPDWAAAHAGLAQAYVLGGTWWGDRPHDEVHSLARPSVERALELDPALAEAHLAKGMLEFILEWDWAVADSAFRRGLELDPPYSYGAIAYSLYLTHMGRVEESIANAEHWLDLDPLSPMVYNELAWAHRHARNHEEALKLLKRSLELDPGFPQTHLVQMLVYRDIGMVDSALAKARTLPISGPNLAAYVGNVFGVVALAWLMRGYEAHDPTMVAIKVAPEFDPLLADPRFQDLLRRMELDGLSDPILRPPTP